jgi:hypothetical protein
MTGEVIFEFQIMAHAVKVSAVDVDTGTEVSIMGPRSASQAELEKTARAKLEWVLGKGGGRRGRTV